MSSHYAPGSMRIRPLASGAVPSLGRLPRRTSHPTITHAFLSVCPSARLPALSRYKSGVQQARPPTLVPTQPCPLRLDISPSFPPFRKVDSSFLRSFLVLQLLLHSQSRATSSTGRQHWEHPAHSARRAHARTTTAQSHLTSVYQAQSGRFQMAAPTAIPHCENSSHHQQHHQPSPNKNSPPPFSPIYTRTAFSLPGGPISPTSSLRNTASGWSTAGAGVNGLRSPPIQRGELNGPHAVRRSSFQSSSGLVPADSFPERDDESTSLTRHHRAFSASSTSDSSSSIESNGPSTPVGSRPTGAPLGRVPSLPMGTSYESIKNKRESWGGNYAFGSGWTPLSFRTGKSPPASTETGFFDGQTQGQPASANANGAGGVGGLFRKLSISSGQSVRQNGGSSSGHNHHHNRGHSHRSLSFSAGQADTTSDALPTAAASEISPSPEVKSRGRQASTGSGNTKRKPSPHGERLLMGWTHAH